MLSKKQLADVCLAHSKNHETCRFLAEDEVDYNKFYCLKLSSKKTEIDIDAEDFIREAKKKGQDPNKSNVPLGDNCKGYPILKHIQQGYDVP